MPVKIWHGRQDGFVPVQHGQWLAACVPGAEAEISEGDGHLTMIGRVGEIRDCYSATSSRVAERLRPTPANPGLGPGHTPGQVQATHRARSRPHTGPGPGHTPGQVQATHRARSRPHTGPDRHTGRIRVGRLEPICLAKSVAQLAPDSNDIAAPTMRYLVPDPATSLEPCCRWSSSTAPTMLPRGEE